VQLDGVEELVVEEGSMVLGQEEPVACYAHAQFGTDVRAGYVMVGALRVHGGRSVCWRRSGCQMEGIEVQLSSRWGPACLAT